MKYWIWRARLGFWCWFYHDGGPWYRPDWCWQYAMQYDCWRVFFDEGYSPRDALMEDWSNAYDPPEP